MDLLLAFLFCFPFFLFVTADDTCFFGFRLFFPFGALFRRLRALRSIRLLYWDAFSVYKSGSQ